MSTTAGRTPYGAEGAPYGRSSARPGRRAPYVFLAPATVLFVLFFALPIGYAVWLSFHKAHVSGLGLGSGARTEVWAGLQNYTEAFRDSELLRGALRVLGYGCVVVPVMLGLALLFALMLDAEKVRLAPVTRLAIFLPYAVPGVVAALLWGFLYLPDVSPFYFVLGRLGLPQPDLLDGGPLFLALSNIAVWGGTGFNMIVIYTSLRSIPVEVYEAAKLDGATPAQIALRIKIPMVAPSLVLTFFFSIIATPGVQRADHPEAAHQLGEHDLESADEGVPGRLRPQRHPLGGGRGDADRRRHAAAVVRLPAGR